MSAESSQSIKLFYCYAHQDRSLREGLDKHLSAMKRAGLITTWYDGEILPGTSWEQEITQQLNTAHIIIILVSSDFIDSEFCYSVELQQALERHDAHEARVLPVLVRPVDLTGTPFKQLQMLPSNSCPITNWSDLDVAFKDVAEGIRRVVSDLHPQLSTQFPVVLEQTGQNGGRAITTLQQSREAFVKWLCSEYEKELVQSLQHTILLALEFSERFDVTRSHTQQVFRRTPHPERPIPLGTTILQIYDQAGPGFLLLGEPGAGKTTLLLDLAIQLLQRAIQQPAHPIPVILNLSSWAEKQFPLALWLVEEMLLWYNVPRHLGQAWVQNSHLLLLLDGLDEVTETVRSDCVAAINAYHEQHSIPLVVCCRTQELLALTKKAQLALPCGITIQTLKQEQVNYYLKQAGSSMRAVRTVLRTNPTLRELITTPLMLNIVTRTYRGKAASELPRVGAAAEQQQKIFNNYIERMLEQRETETPYTAVQIIDWLIKLAKQMQQHNQSVFYIERIQPNWLSRKWELTYDFFAMKIPGALLGLLISFIVLTAFTTRDLITVQIGFLGGLLGWLFSRECTCIPSGEKKTAIWEWVKGSFAAKRSLSINTCVGVGYGLCVSLSVGAFHHASSGSPDALIFGICGGIAAFLLGTLATNGVLGRGRPISLRKTSPNFWIDMWFHTISTEYLRQGILAGLIAGGCEGLAAGVQRSFMRGPLGGLLYGLQITLFLSLFFSTVGIVLGLILFRRRSAVEPIEKVDWSWHQLRESLFEKKHLKNTLLVMLFVGLFYGIVNFGWNVLFPERVFISLFLGFSGGVVWGWIYWALVGFFYGVPSKDFDEHTSISPNQGIRRSLSVSLRTTGISSAVSWFVCFLALIVFYGSVKLVEPKLLQGQNTWSQLWQGAIWQGLGYGLLVGLLVGMSNGGFACLQHYIIRLLLWLDKSTSWHYVQFLDIATQYTLLRKHGGGYEFLHPLFLTYFASLAQISRTNVEPDK